MRRVKKGKMSGRVNEPTRELYELVYANAPPSLQKVKCLIDAKADPYEHVNARHNIIGAAAFRENCDVLRLLYGRYPDIIHHRVGSEPLLGYCVTFNHATSAECLMELGVRYKHLKFDFLKPNANLAALYARFIAREEHCKVACSSLLSAPVRALIGRDLACLLAGLVWRGHRGAIWEEKNP